LDGVLAWDLGRAHESSDLDRRLWISAALNITITLGELAGGLLAGSLALLVNALHNFADAAALGIAIFAREVGRRAPTPRHTYGLKRAEIITALLNASVLIAISLLIGRAALGRLFHPEVVRASVMLVVALIALAANLASVFLLKSHGRKDINARRIFAPAARCARLLCGRRRSSFDANPDRAECRSSCCNFNWICCPAKCRFYRSGVASYTLGGCACRSECRGVGASGLGALPGCSSAPHFHVWEVGPGQRILTAHMKTGAESIVEFEGIAASLRRYLHEEWEIEHATLQAEANGCGREEILGAWR
jgi:cobalt-zinc-cadmium efflux system protein